MVEKTYIYKTESLKNSKHFYNNMPYKLKLHKMKVDIKGDLE